MVVKIIPKMKKIKKKTLAVSHEGQKKGWILLEFSKILLDGSSGWSNQGGSILGHVLCRFIVTQIILKCQTFHGE